ncbi:MAG: TonB-dependent receptor plug domain-containing protein, partial [Gammaproteobacteria bacterium]|nr:TonB-dependent receptor plug domain-containing protein [Gammaproteobacteria bacterium]
MKMSNDNKEFRKSIMHLSLLMCLGSGAAMAGGQQTLELDAISVEGQADELPGVVDSATVGTITAEQLKNRPMARTGELMEVVPGLIVSQHSGEGKANQYYLRGFNLDHGTDLATFVDDVPVNMPTHAHGQGWTDTNFVIPELIDNIQYKKGPYYAEEGDFSAAGAVRMYYANKLDKGITKVEGGQFGYYRALAADSARVDGGDLLYAFDISQYDGPWDLPQNYDKKNIMFRYTKGDRKNGFTLAALSYRGDWQSTDQIPLRAVDSIGLWGNVDPTDGGISH